MEPRSFTRNSLSNILEFDFSKGNTSNENLWLAILHLSSFVCIVFVPLLLWKKESSYKIDRQGRDVLNFQITITLVLFAFMLFLLIAPVALFMTVTQVESGTANLSNIFVLLMPLSLLLIAIFTAYQGVVNTFHALSEKPIRYPLSIPFVKYTWR